MNDLAHWAWDELEDDYGEPHCPRCGCEAEEYDVEKDGDGFEPYSRGSCSDYMCGACRLVLGSDEAFGDEPLGHTLDKDGYEGEVHGDDGGLFVTKSPYFTHAQFCSPCAPGACHLRNPVDEGGPRAYCLGHDWFEENQAPYPVYRVEDGSLVPPS